MATSRTSAVILAQERLKELRLLRAARFNFITTTEFRENVLAGFNKYQKDYEEWFDKIHLDILDLENRGLGEQAEKLSDTLLGNSLVSDPGNFTVYIPTAFSNEQWQIMGSTSTHHLRSNQSGNQSRPVTGQKPPPDVEVLHSNVADAGRSLQAADESHFLSLAEAIDLDIDEAESSKWETITVQQAKRHKLWMSRTLSGVIFCVECDCPEMVLPMGAGPGSSTTEIYDLFTRHFHVDPLHQEHALIHFLQVHKEGFSGVKSMLEKHGRRVTLEDSSEDATLDSYDIAGHNLSVRFWYNSLFSRWDSLKQSCQDSSSRSSRQLLQSHDRTIGFSKVSPAACVFPWPDRHSEHWVVMCNHPDCQYPDFEHHPLRKGRAQEHFFEHGLRLEDDHDVLRLFGFKVLNYQPENHIDDDKPQSLDPPSRKQRRDESGRPRLINGRDVYHIWSYDALKDECIRRKIPLPDNYIKKASLEKKLRLHDGVPDYEAKGIWPYERLREECIKRSIPITSKQMNNVYKRPDLIKMLERDDVRLRVEAAQAGQRATSEALQVGTVEGPQVGSGEASQVADVSNGDGKLNDNKLDNDERLNGGGALDNDDSKAKDLPPKRGRGRPPKGSSRLPVPQPQAVQFEIPIRSERQSNGGSTKARESLSRRASLRPSSRSATSLGFYHDGPRIKEEPEDY